MKNLIWLTLSLVALYLITVSTTNFGRSSKNSATANPLEVVQIGKMTVDRAAHQATLLNDGQVLITGGCAGQGCTKIHSSAELYDPTTQSFKPLSPMSTARASHTAIALNNGRVLVAGGWTGTQATNSAEIYDPATDQWEIVDTMSDDRASHVSVLLQNSTVFIMGGGGGRLGNLSSVEIFDPSSGSFLKVGGSKTNHYLATLLANGRVLMTGGQNKNGKIHNTAEIYDPTTKAFKKTGVMDTPRVKHAAVLMDDGHVLVMGDSDSRGYQGRYSGTEIFDPETDKFSKGPDMQYGRHKIQDAVVKLHSGHILIAGGAVKPEVFDPYTQEFISVTGQLSGPQMFATATLLSDGNVLILGGYDDRIRTSASAWLVDSGNKNRQQ